MLVVWLDQNKHTHLPEKYTDGITPLSRSTRSFVRNTSKYHGVLFATHCVGRPSAHGLTGWLLELFTRQLFFCLLLLPRSCMIPFFSLPALLLTAILKKYIFLAQTLRNCSISSPIKIIVLLQCHLATVLLDWLQQFCLGKWHVLFSIVMETIFARPWLIECTFTLKSNGLK